MLGRAFDYAIYRGVIEKNPANMVRLKAKKGESIPILDFTEADIFLNYCLNSDDPIAWGVAILLKTGMRIGELCGLRFDCIDLEKRKIHIQRALRRIPHPKKHQANDYELINT